MHQWMPSILEISLLGLRTEAAATAADLIGFLCSNPTPQEVMDYHVSEERQNGLNGFLS